MQAMTQLPLIMLCTYVQIKVSRFKHSIVLNGLRCGIVRLFDSFVPRRSIIYFKEWCQTPMYSHEAVVAGEKKYRVPKIECPGAHRTLLNDTEDTRAFCQGSRFTSFLSMEGGLSVIMVMGDCQCSYTGLFGQVPGVIGNGRVFSKPKPPPYFHSSQSCMARGCNFFFHQLPGQTLSRKVLVWP